MYSNETGVACIEKREDEDSAGLKWSEYKPLP